MFRKRTFRARSERSSSSLLSPKFGLLPSAFRLPVVPLLDKPTENLNETNRVEMARFVHNYAKGGNKRTCIVISHDMNFVQLVADRI